MAATGFPSLRSVIVDTTDARALAEFYRQLLGFRYRPGDEFPPGGQPDTKGQDWLILEDPTGGLRLGFQQVELLPRSSWPEVGVPQQIHLDLSVPRPEDLATQKQRVLELGGQVLYDRSGDAQEPLYVFADPAGHPFCIFVVPVAPRAP